MTRCCTWMADTDGFGKTVDCQGMYTVLRMLLRPDIAYRVKAGRVIDHGGRNSDTNIDDIEAVCQIHKVEDGILLGKWTDDHYRITLFGALKSVRVPLNNVIN